MDESRSASAPMASNTMTSTNRTHLRNYHDNYAQNVVGAIFEIVGEGYPASGYSGIVALLFLFVEAPGTLRDIRLRESLIRRSGYHTVSIPH
ncbi:hypothetical protein PYCCODRAFT_1096478 [Trametes coccinea BRFM310]|uniref:Uncharacterized protein n=1 Tax=Trametes coccinea (strain BRFM310) TaxID=1353009 RepID=A0A1Y2I9L4_TRAC3|nr:hypothetical protein PYCCODRAFT_1096478 [Trametes coccinea BRFM310]